MAMVFSRDLLFLHVAKAGGTSISRYLLEVLPRPVYYVGPKKASADLDPNELIHVEGNQHQRLAEASAFLRARGLELSAFPLILAVVRDPYDLFVSHYAFQRLRHTRFTLLDAGPKPPPECEIGARHEAFEPILRRLTAGTVARIEPAAEEDLVSLRSALAREAIRLGCRVEIWEYDGHLYAAPNRSRSRRPPVRELAQDLDFRDFAIATNTGRRQTFLGRLYDYFHIGGTIPPNLRILRFERLADDLTSALASIGIECDAALPWLNRSPRDAAASYYDRETEAIVYEQTKWLFDRGFYERLDLAVTASSESRHDGTR